LATGIAGVLAGSMFVRMIAYLFGKGLGKEALGLGDADLMMMAGAFLGWQPAIIAFFVSVFPALVVGVVQIIVHRDNSMPFGPSLAVGILVTMLCWKWIGPTVQILFFCDWLLLLLLALVAGFMFVSSFVLGRFRRKR
jgi:leader peptidase (prepilin peptidase)/N-methyltransferase